MLLLLIIPWAVANGLAIGSEYRASVNWKIKGTPNKELYFGSPYGLGEKNKVWSSNGNLTPGCGPYSQVGTFLSWWLLVSQRSVDKISPHWIS